MKIKWRASEWKWKRKFSIISKRESPKNVMTCPISCTQIGLCGEGCENIKSYTTVSKGAHRLDNHVCWFVRSVASKLQQPLEMGASTNNAVIGELHRKRGALYRCTILLLYRSTVVPLYRFTAVPLYYCTAVPFYPCTVVLLCLCTNVPLYRCTVLPL